LHSLSPPHPANPCHSHPDRLRYPLAASATPLLDLSAPNTSPQSLPPGPPCWLPISSHRTRFRPFQTTCQSGCGRPVHAAVALPAQDRPHVAANLSACKWLPVSLLPVLLPAP